MIERYGADTLRLFSMFAAPPDQSMEWSDSGVDGGQRFLNRLWRQVALHVEKDASSDAIIMDGLNDQQQKLYRKLHLTLEKVTDDMSRRFTFNTAIAANMELLNDLSKFQGDDEQSIAVRQQVLDGIVLMLSPVTPHLCQALWNELGHKGLIIDESWPEVDESALVQSTIQLIVQVNGKVRGKIDVAADADKESIEKLAQANENVFKFINGLTVRKIIVVPGRLVNIVAN
jgi:leucyl-tRNA synthetase